MGHWIRHGRGLLHRRQSVVVTDLTVQVSTTLVVSVDVDASGAPTSTTTISPTASPSSTPQLSSSPSASSAAPAPTIATSVATNSGSQIPLATPPSSPVSGANATGTVTAAGSTTTGLAGLSSSGNSTNPSASGSSPPSAITAASNGTSSTSSSLSSISSSNLASSISSSSLLSSLEPSSSSMFLAPTGAGIGVGGGAPTSFPTSHNRNGTAKAPNDNGASPPVVAGAVVGSVGGMAVILLVIVLLARWWKHHSRNSRYEEGGESSLDLNPSHGPIMSQRRSFLAAAGWLHRLSGGHNRSSSPTIPSASQQEPRFQKISGRKLPSQFPTGVEEGPMARDFGQATTRQNPAHASDTSSYYRDSRDTTQFFGGPSAVPPLFAGAVSESPSPPEAGPSTHPPGSSHYSEIEKETLMPSPARTPVIHTGGPYPRDLTPPPNPPHLNPRPNFLGRGGAS